MSSEAQGTDAATVAWISVAPVKGLRLEARSEVRVTESGIPGDRAFFLVDENGAMISATRLGPLLGIVPAYDAEAGLLSLRLPTGETVSGQTVLGEDEEVTFYGERIRTRPVLGPFSTALSEHCGKTLRLLATPKNRPGVDRGEAGAVTLLSVASLRRLQIESDERREVDPRRFRMTFGLDGLSDHQEDTWIGREVLIGEARARVGGVVGRCAATTRNADTGRVDFKTLHYLRAYRGKLSTPEPLPFGIYASVTTPGTVRLHDPVKALPRAAEGRAPQG